MIKQILLTMYPMLPLPISKYMYSIARNILFLDARRPYFDTIFENISSAKLAGDYLEFGVFRGTSFIMASKLAKKYSMHSMRFFAFDSFQGLPDSEGKVCSKGEFSCSEELFKKTIKKSDIDLSKVITVKGFYNNYLKESLKYKYNIKSLVVHIDCDLYNSTKGVLNFMTNIISPGTIIIFDDWDAFKYEDDENMGEKKAFKEWSLFNCFEEYCDLSDGSKAFIMKEPDSLIS
jgi:O-methyltransferase